MKTFAFLVGLALLATSCSTQNALVGNWNCINATIDGKPLAESKAGGLQLLLTKDRYKTQRGSEVLFDSTYSVDPSAHPSRITMIGTEGDLTGKEAQGIYSVSGDTLLVCYTMPGNPRPVAFESIPGSGAYLITWKREKR